MPGKPEADRDELIQFLVAQSLAADLKIEDATWESISKDDAATLKNALNKGINPDDVRLRLVQHSHPDGGPVHYVVAAYDDVVGDFWARYISQGTWLVASYEN